MIRGVHSVPVGCRFTCNVRGKVQGGQREKYSDRWTHFVLRLAIHFPIFPLIHDRKPVRSEGEASHLASESIFTDYCWGFPVRGQVRFTTPMGFLFMHR